MNQESNFLRDQIHRLTVELDAFQKKYPPLNEKDFSLRGVLSLEDPLPDWFVDEKSLHPLLLAYDSRILQLETERGNLEKNTVLLKDRMYSVIQENERLHVELKAQYEMAIKQGEIRNLHSNDGWKESQKALELLEEENEILLSQIDVLNDEISTLRKSGATSLPSTAEQQSAKSTEALSQEIVRLQGENARLRAQSDVDREELARASAREQTLRRSVDQCGSQQPQQQQQQQHAEPLSLPLATLTDLKTQLKAYEDSIRMRDHELKRLRADREHHKQRTADMAKKKKELFDTIGSLEARLVESDHKASEHYQHIQESIAMVEAAGLERDQALVRVADLETELRRMRDSLADQRRELKAQAEEDAQGRYAGLKAQTVDLSTRLQEALARATEADAHLNRAIREKRAVEQELERVSKASPSEAHRLGGIIDQLTARLRQAEGERDNAREGQQQAVERGREQMLESARENGKIAAAKRALEEKLALREEDIAALKGRLAEQLGEHRALQKEHEVLVRQFEAECLDKEKAAHITRVQHTAETKTLAKKVTVLTEERDGLLVEVQELLAQNSLLNTKWHNESSRAVELLSQKLKDVNARVKMQEEEILALRQTNATLESEKRLGEKNDYAMRNELETGLRALVADANNARLVLQSKLSEEQDRVARLLREKSFLENELERAEVEIARTGRLTDDLLRRLDVEETRGQLTALCAPQRQLPADAEEVDNLRSLVGALTTEIKKLKAKLQTQADESHGERPKT